MSREGEEQAKGGHTSPMAMKREAPVIASRNCRGSGGEQRGACERREGSEEQRRGERGGFGSGSRGEERRGERRGEESGGKEVSSASVLGLACSTVKADMGAAPMNMATRRCIRSHTVPRAWVTALLSWPRRFIRSAAACARSGGRCARSGGGAGDRWRSEELGGAIGGDRIR